jgi:hypothetical protein
VSWHFRCVDGMTLRVALEQSLRCPLLGAAGPQACVAPPASTLRWLDRRPTLLMRRMLMRMSRRTASTLANGE